MLAIRTILHPTDFSPQAETAFELACALARDYDARLVVLHVRVPPPVIYGDGMMPLPAPDSHETLRQRLENLRAVDPSVKLERRFVDGPAVDEIVREAKETRCDLIVMGTHGWTGLSRLFMGSVAEGVLRRAPCPVLTVKTPRQTDKTVSSSPTKPASSTEAAKT
jgi:nucleotide-binding universal stress UspA family protein